MFLLIRNRTNQIVYAIPIDRIKGVYASSSKDSDDKYFYKLVILTYDDDTTGNYEEPYNLNDLMSQIEKLGV